MSRPGSIFDPSEETKNHECCWNCHFGIRRKVITTVVNCELDNTPNELENGRYYTYRCDEFKNRDEELGK